MGLFREIDKAVSGHGHGCGCYECLHTYIGGASGGVDKVLCWRLAAASVLFVAAWIASRSMSALSLVLAVLSILCAGYDRFIRAVVVCVRERKLDEELLMFIVAVAAVSIGHALEGAVGTILLQLSALLSSYAANKALRGLDALDGGEAGLDLLNERKTRAEEFIAHFARFYTPVVLGIAVIIAVVTPLLLHAPIRDGIYRSLILLVIACPCALIVSVPLAYLAGAGSAARQGIRFQSTRAMDDLNRTGVVVFDQKTALEGEGLRVLSVKSERMDADTLLRIAAHACAYSDGVYAQSIKAACTDTIYIELIQSFMQEVGRGITVEVDGVSIILGIEDFVRENGVDPGIDAVPETSAYLAIDGQYAGRILFGAVAWPQVTAAVESLSWESERRIVMLSEEPTSAAEKFSRLVGIGQYYAGCSPEEKESIVKDLKERLKRNETLVFAGDVSSDPNCFDLADVGVSAGGGTDVSAAHAGPAEVLRAIRTATRTNGIVLQNIIGILAFKLLVLALDMLGVCPLWLAVFADAGVSVAAVLNAIRALHWREDPLTEE